MENQVNEPVQTKQQNTKKGGLSTKGIIILVSSIVAALLIIIVIIMMLFPSPKSVAKKFCSGYEKMNVAKILSTVHPKMKSDVNDNLEDWVDFMKEMKIKIKSVKLDPDYEEVEDDEFELYSEQLEEEYDISESSIKEMRRYAFEVKASYDGETGEEENSVVLAKIGMKWYAVD